MGKLYEPSYRVEFTKQVSNHYAVDIASDVITTGVVYDIDVIKQSITNIILTMMGERLFNLQFGTNLYGMIFNSNVSVNTAQTLKSHVIDRVLTYEKRVSIIEEDSRVLLDADNNEIILQLSFIVNQTAESAVWENTIIL